MGIRNNYILIGIVALASILRIWGIGAGLPYLNRYFWENDEGNFIHLAMSLGGGDLNPHSYNNPHLFLYLLFSLYGVFYAVGKILHYFQGSLDYGYFYFTNLSPFYLIGRSVSIIAGVSTIYVTYLIGLKNFDKRVGLVAAFFLSVTGLHVAYSQIVKTEATYTLLAMISLYFSLSVIRCRKASALLGYYILSGLIAGLAASTKYQGGFVAVSLLVAYTFRWRNMRDVWTRGETGGLVLGLAACGLGFFIGSPYFAIEPQLAIAGMRQLGAVHSSLLTESGTTAKPWLLSHLLAFADSQAMSPMLVGISLLGVAYACMKRTGADSALLAFVAVMYIFFSWPWFSYSSVQFMLPIVPPLLILGARLLVATIPQRLTGGIFTCVVLLFGLWPMTAVVDRGMLLSRPRTTALAKRWIEENIPARSKILLDSTEVPQLSFTKPALVRSRASVDTGRVENLLSKSREASLGMLPAAERSRLTMLREKSLTEIGVPYDIYILGSVNIFTHPIIQQEYFQKGFANVVQEFDIEYVVIRGDPEQSIQDHLGKEFYTAVILGSELLKTFSPEDTGGLGPKLRIFKVRRGIGSR